MENGEDSENSATLSTNHVAESPSNSPDGDPRVPSTDDKSEQTKSRRRPRRRRLIQTKTITTTTTRTITTVIRRKPKRRRKKNNLLQEPIAQINSNEVEVIKNSENIQANSSENKPLALDIVPSLVAQHDIEIQNTSKEKQPKNQVLVVEKPKLSLHFLIAV